MKKILLFIVITFITVSKVVADYDDSFMRALKNCTPYSSNGAVDVQGISADYSTKILGWENNKCSLVKKISLSNANICINCNFTRQQIYELTKTMATYGGAPLDKGIDISNPDSIQNSPIMNIFNKYLSDPSTCIMDVQ